MTELQTTGAFRVDVLAIGEYRWATNALRFDTKEAASAYAVDLFTRWTMADHMRVVPSDHAEHEAYVTGSEDF